MEKQELERLEEICRLYRGKSFLPGVSVDRGFYVPQGGSDHHGVSR